MHTGQVNCISLNMPCRVIGKVPAGASGDAGAGGAEDGRISESNWPVGQFEMNNDYCLMYNEGFGLWPRLFLFKRHATQILY